MRLATRGSALALAQAEQVAAALGGAEVVPVRSADGDIDCIARLYDHILIVECHFSGAVNY